MKRSVILAVLCAASSAFAQTIGNWTIRDVPNQGVIARTEVIGLATRDGLTKRARTAMSLVCFTEGPYPQNAKVMIQWEGLQGYGNRRIAYTLDGKPPTPNATIFVMRQDHEILYRDLVDSREFLQAMKTGSTLTVDWVGFDQTRYLTTFNLSTFRSNLSEFNKKCNTNF